MVVVIKAIHYFSSLFLFLSNSPKLGSRFCCGCDEFLPIPELFSLSAHLPGYRAAEQGNEEG